MQSLNQIPCLNEEDSKFPPSENKKNYVLKENCFTR